MMRFNPGCCPAPTAQLILHPTGGLVGAGAYTIYDTTCRVKTTASWDGTGWRATIDTGSDNSMRYSIGLTTYTTDQASLSDCSPPREETGAVADSETYTGLPIDGCNREGFIAYFTPVNDAAGGFYFCCIAGAGTLRDANAYVIPTLGVPVVDVAGADPFYTSDELLWSIAGGPCDGVSGSIYFDPDGSLPGGIGSYLWRWADPGGAQTFVLGTSPFDPNWGWTINLSCGADGGSTTPTSYDPFLLTASLSIGGTLTITE